MGLGHVPAGPLRVVGPGGDLQGRQRRGAPGEGALIQRPAPDPAGPAALGRGGEDRAARWYEQRGWRVLDRNWRTRTGEIDLILGRPGLVVFAEVKARRGERFGSPAEAVTGRKQATIRRVAGAWLAAHPTRGAREVRFDVVTELRGELDVIEAAF